MQSQYFQRVIMDVYLTSNKTHGKVHNIDRYSTVTARYAALYRKGLIDYTGENAKVIAAETNVL